jgi:hypothetical protein
MSKKNKEKKKDNVVLVMDDTLNEKEISALVFSEEVERKAKEFRESLDRSKMGPKAYGFK